MREGKEAETAGFLVREIEARSVLSKSGISAVTYALNPYVGCQHGCVYCYSVFMKRFTGHGEEWGTFVDVKVNAPQVLAREVKRAKPGEVLLSSVTDPYQPLEREYRLTRACLEILREHPQFPVSILTKSTLVLRDLDLLSQIEHLEVAFTITGLDEAARRVFEPQASPTRARIEALARLSETGLKVWAFFGPALPYISDGEKEIEDLFRELKEAGVKRVLVDSLNLKGAMWGRVKRAVSLHYPDLLEAYRLLAVDRRAYSSLLGERAQRAAAKYGLECEICF
jgi:DNA repair photolyase